MLDWWESLSFLSKFFYYIAIPATTVLLIQSILTIIGVGANSDGDIDFDGDMGGDMDFDADTGMSLDSPNDITFDLDHDGADDFDVLSGVADFRFVTIRGIIAFLTMFGWVGAALSNAGVHPAISIIGATLAGFASMFIIALLFYGISKLQGSGNIIYRNAIGREATVYIPIPGDKIGFGKIQLLLQERFIEANAVTEEKEMIGTNQPVRIIDMLNATTFVVERLK